jgi:CDP-paratose 2-epimerase
MTRRGAQENACWLKSRWRDRVHVFTADIRDEGVVSSLIADCRAVLHLAGQVAVTTSVDDPLGDFSINAAGTVHLLEWVRRRNPSAALIFASTNKVYGEVTRAPELTRSGFRYEPIAAERARGIAENAPLDLYSPYGCSKGAADQYVHDYARVFGLRTVVLRMSCIYGPRQFGTEDQGWLAHFVIKALRDEPITIYGDGYQVRDALFIDDAVNAWLAALDNVEHISGRVFNLGGGPENATSLLEAIGCIGELQGRQPRLNFAEWRPGDQPWYVSDIRAISAALGWTPQVKLHDGLRALHSWLSERFATPQPAPELERAAV